MSLDYFQGFIFCIRFIFPPVAKIFHFSLFYFFPQVGVKNRKMFLESLLFFLSHVFFYFFPKENRNICPLNFCKKYLSWFFFNVKVTLSLKPKKCNLDGSEKSQCILLLWNRGWTTWIHSAGTSWRPLHLAVTWLGGSTTNTESYPGIIPESCTKQNKNLIS